MLTPPGEPRVAELAESLEFLSDVLHQLRDLEPTAPVPAPLGELAGFLRERPHLSDLPDVVLRAHQEISVALTGIRLTRETIESHALGRLRDTNSRLSEVSSTTESATLQILDGLDGAIDRIDALQERVATPADSAELDHLRRDVNALFSHLQFQDITSQQLRGVGQFLEDLEHRMSRVVVLLDYSMVGAPGGQVTLDCGLGAPAPATFDPAASLRDVGPRQAEIDRTLAARSGAARPTSV